jgi:hypothetical protein
MQNSAISNPVFREAVEAIDAGNVSVLTGLLEAYPELVMKPLDLPEEGYFKNPYLLWFIADNPIRHEKLPQNIADITRIIISAIKVHAPETLQDQLNYTLALVVTGRIPRESGVQIELIDLLIDEGAVPGSGHDAIAHGNLEAASRLIDRGSKLTLATAICIGRNNDIPTLLDKADGREKQIALVAASFYGKPEMVRLLLDSGADVNAYLDSNSGFHYHATALHQAVYSGSLESVKLLVEAGASLTAEDLIYDSTPLDWAIYMQKEIDHEESKNKYRDIEKYLQTLV